MLYEPDEHLKRDAEFSPMRGDEALASWASRRLPARDDAGGEWTALSRVGRVLPFRRHRGGR